MMAMMTAGCDDGCNDRDGCDEGYRLMACNDGVCISMLQELVIPPAGRINIDDRCFPDYEYWYKYSESALEYFHSI